MPVIWSCRLGGAGRAAHAHAHAHARAIARVLAIAAALAAACAPPRPGEPEAPAEAAAAAPLYGSELGDFADTGVELGCSAITEGVSTVNALAGVACLGAYKYATWCNAQLAAGKSLGECMPTQCNMGSWLPQLAGAFQTGPIGETMQLIGRVAALAAATFDTAAGGPCSSGLWCALYHPGTRPHDCATDTGPGTISACLISKACGFLGKTKVIGPGPGDIFTPQTCEIYPVCRFNVVPASTPWQPGDQLSGRASEASLPAPIACAPPPEPAPIAPVCSFPLANATAPQLELWASGHAQRKKQVIMQLLSGVRAYRVGSLAATTTHHGSIEPLWPADRAISDAALRELAQYAQFAGCRERGQLAELPWFAKLLSDTRDAADASAGLSAPARLMARLEFLTLVRILAAIPNLEARLDHLTSRAWCQQDGDAFLAGVTDHDAILLGALGPVGFRILRGALPHYRWLAVPAPGEPPLPPDHCEREAACTKALPPEFTLTVAPIEQTHRARLAITADPDDVDGGLAFVGIEWGDGSAQTFAFGTDPTFTVEHPYPGAGTYPVRARLTSDAGVTGERTASVTLASASPQPSPLRRTIRALRLHGSAVVPIPLPGGPATGDVLVVEASAVLADGRASTLGAARVVFTPATPRTRIAIGERVDLPPIELEVPRAHLPYALRLRVRSEQASPNLRYRHVQLASIELELEASTGPAPAPREWVAFRPNPASAFLRPATGAPQALRMDLDGGFVMLPVDDTVVEIGLPIACREPPGGGPIPRWLGCRPAYDAAGAVVPHPRFASANGGCFDRDTLLAWSTASPQPRSWMDLVWSAATPGSAPADAEDAFANDQDRKTQHADTGAGGYCHDLDEGGYTNWRMPRIDELLGVMTKEAAWRSFAQLDASLLSSTSADASYARKHGYAPNNYLYDYQFPGGSPAPSDAPLSNQIAQKAPPDRYALCVRDAPVTRHYCRGAVTGDGTFRSASGGCADTRGAGPTHRVWSRPSAAELPQAQAAAHCAALREAELADWRLPLRAELATTIDNTTGTKHFDRYFDTTTLGGGTYNGTGFWASDGRWPSAGATGRVICVRDAAAPLVLEEPPAPVAIETAEYGSCGLRMTTR